MGKCTLNEQTAAEDLRSSNMDTDIHADASNNGSEL